MIDKKVDGIKKMDKKDVEKSRRIVLESINKQAKDLVAKNNISELSANKKVDGILAVTNPKISNKDASLFGLTPALAKSMYKKQTNSTKQKDKRHSLNKREHRQDKIIKKQTADDFIAKNKAQKEESKIEAHQKKQEAKKKALREKAQKKADLKKERDRLKKEKAVKKQINKLKFKKNTKISLKKIITYIKKGYKRALAIIGISVILGIMFYLFMVLLVLKLNFDNNFFRTINTYAPIPAYVTREGIVDYYSYIDIKTQIAKTENNTKNIAEFSKIKIVENFIYDKLINAYGLKGGEYNDIKVEVEKKIIFDKGVNQVGINRIQKIKEMIGAGGNFVKVASKYGDTQGLLNINNTSKEQISYADKVSHLNIGEVSDIVSADDGYYIFRCYDLAGDNIALSYVYVRGITLDEYINEEVKNYRLWSLVD